jgi:ribose transport system ATP-binding protein
MSKLAVSGVSKAYGATVALSHGDLTLEKGEVHVLIGSNGSGKSTLCKIVAGSVRPDSGEMLIDGKPVVVSGPQAGRVLGIGIFYQELSLAAGRTVEENICLPDMPVKAGLFVDRTAMSERAARYIALFDGVTGDGFLADATVDSLRADQRQLVEIMKTLATEAPILIFDEPTSALDRAQVDRFFEILNRLKTEGRAMVFISHRMDEIFALGDRVTVMRDGRTVATSRIADTDSAKVIRLMVGDQGELAPPVQPGEAHTDGEVALTAKGFRAVGLPKSILNCARARYLGLAAARAGAVNGAARAVRRASDGDRAN